jgi:hypothetical protein
MRISTALIAVCALGPIHGAVSTEARADDRKAPTAETTVMTDKGRHLEEAPKPIPDAGPKNAIVVGGAAISLAALGTGVALFAVASGKGTDADQMVSQLESASAPLCAKASTTGACGDLFSLRQDQGTFHNTGIALLVGGSVVAVGTVAYALWPRGKQATRDAWILPVVGTDGAGVWLRGAF